MRTEAGFDAGPEERRLARLATVLSLVLALAGIGLAGYLAAENLQGQSGVCTGALHACATLQQSRYSKVFGIPVSVPGVGMYAALATASVARIAGGQAGRLATLAAFFVALAGFLFSAFLTSIEAFILDAWCIYCVCSAILATLLFALWLALFLVESRREGALSASPAGRPAASRQ